MSNYSGEFVQEHPIISLFIFIAGIGMTVTVHHFQSKNAFNNAVAQCQRGVTPQHVKARDRFGYKAQRRENARTRRVNRAIDRALRSPEYTLKPH